MAESRHAASSGGSCVQLFVEEIKHISGVSEPIEILLSAGRARLEDQSNCFAFTATEIGELNALIIWRGELISQCKLKDILSTKGDLDMFTPLREVEVVKFLEFAILGSIHGIGLSRVDGARRGSGRELVHRRFGS